MFYWPVIQFGLWWVNWCVADLTQWLGKMSTEPQVKNLSSTGFGQREIMDAYLQINAFWKPTFFFFYSKAWPHCSLNLVLEVEIVESGVLDYSNKPFYLEPSPNKIIKSSGENKKDKHKESHFPFFRWLVSSQYFSSVCQYCHFVWKPIPTWEFLSSGMWRSGGQTQQSGPWINIAPIPMLLSFT